MSFSARTRLLAPPCALWLFAGCASLPAEIPRVRSQAFSPANDSPIGHLVGPALVGHPGLSGFRAIDDGGEGLAARAALADLAGRSIDVQTFLWPGDRVGDILWQRLIRAADRGVRVRLLIDDIELDGEGLALLAHPNIEVRVFNPFAARHFGRMVELIRRFDILDHRMHNKLFIVDNEALIIGGRNVADDYFGLSAQRDFRDLDLLVVGPIVPTASQAFDEYWNCGWSYPAASLLRLPPREQLRRARAYEATLDAAVATSPLRIDADPRPAALRIERLRDGLVFGQGTLRWDNPDQRVGEPVGETPSPPLAAMRELTAGARREIVIESAYFAPDPDLRSLREARLRGVAITLLTNSLATTNHVAVHTSYARLRPSLLRSGVGLFELRPDAALRRRFIADPSSTAAFGLHTKVAVFDGEIVATGSFNFDARSAFLNTEIILVARCPALARSVLALLAPDFDPANSWRLSLGRAGGVEWEIGEGARAHTTGFEPASLGRKVKALLLSLLPIDGET